MAHGWIMIWGMELFWLVVLIGAAAVGELAMERFQERRPMAVNLLWRRRTL